MRWFVFPVLLLLATGFRVHAQVPAYLESMRYRNPTSYDIFSLNYSRPSAASNSSNQQVAPASSLGLPGFSTTRYSRADYARMAKEARKKAEADSLQALQAAEAERNRALYQAIHLKSEADKGVSRAAYQYVLLGYSVEKEPYIEMAANSGIYGAMNYMAMKCLAMGNSERAVYWMNRLAPQDRSFYYKIACLCLNPFLRAYDTAYAMHALEQGAGRGDTLCTRTLAWLKDSKTKAQAQLSLTTEIVGGGQVGKQSWMLVETDQESYSARLQQWEVTGKKAIVNEAGRLITPFAVEEVAVIDNRMLAWRSAEGDWTFIDLNGRKLSKRPFQAYRVIAAAGVIEVYSNGLWGVIDSLGRQVVDATYVYLHTLDAGRYEVVDSDRVYIISHTGQKIPGTERALALSLQGETLCDNSLTDFCFRVVHRYPDGNLLVQRKGATANGPAPIGIVGPDLLWRCNPDLLLVQDPALTQDNWRVFRNGKAGVLRNNGRFLIQPQWDDIAAIDRTNFSWLVRQGKQYGVADATDAVIIRPAFDTVLRKVPGWRQQHPLDRLDGFVARRGGDEYYFDLQGRPAHDTGFAVHAYAPHATIIRYNQLLYLADTGFGNRTALPYEAARFTGDAGLVLVSKGNKWGIWERSTATELAGCQFDAINAQLFDDTRYVGIKTGRFWGMYDVRLKQVHVAPAYDSLCSDKSYVRPNLVKVRLYDKWGILGTEGGKLLIPCTYPKLGDIYEMDNDAAGYERKLMLRAQHPYALTSDIAVNAFDGKSWGVLRVSDGSVLVPFNLSDNNIPLAMDYANDRLQYARNGRGWIYYYQSGSPKYFIDSTGAIKIKAFWYGSIEPLSPNAFVVHQFDPGEYQGGSYQRSNGKGKVGMIDAEGRYLVPLQPFNTFNTGIYEYLEIDYAGKKTRYDHTGKKVRQ